MFTEEHAQGPFASISFSKGSEPQTITPADEAYFIDMKLDYTVDATGINSTSSVHRALSIYPNPFSQQTSISFAIDEIAPIGIRIYSLNGMLVRDSKYMPVTTGEQSIHWNGKDKRGSELPAGVYFNQLQLKSEMTTGRVIKGRSQD